MGASLPNGPSDDSDNPPIGGLCPAAGSMSHELKSLVVAALSLGLSSGFVDPPSAEVAAALREEGVVHLSSWEKLMFLVGGGSVGALKTLIGRGVSLSQHPTVWGGAQKIMSTLGLSGAGAVNAFANQAAPATNPNPKAQNN